jgi:hypothetical protein
MTTTNTSMKLVLTLGFGRETVDSNLPVAEEHGNFFSSLFLTDRYI